MQRIGLHTHRGKLTKETAMFPHRFSAAFLIAASQIKPFSPEGMTGGRPQPSKADLLRGSFQIAFLPLFPQSPDRMGDDIRHPEGTDPGQRGCKGLVRNFLPFHKMNQRFSLHFHLRTFKYQIVQMNCRSTARKHGITSTSVPAACLWKRQCGCFQMSLRNRPPLQMPGAPS